MFFETQLGTKVMDGVKNICSAFDKMLLTIEKAKVKK